MKKLIFTLLLFIPVFTNASSLGGVDASFLDTFKDWAFWILSIAMIIGLVVFFVTKVFSINLPEGANQILNYLLIAVSLLWAVSVIESLMSAQGGSGFLIY